MKIHGFQSKHRHHLARFDHALGFARARRLRVVGDLDEELDLVAVEPNVEPLFFDAYRVDLLRLELTWHRRSLPNFENRCEVCERFAHPRECHHLRLSLAHSPELTVSEHQEIVISAVQNEVGGPLERRQIELYT